MPVRAWMAGGVHRAVHRLQPRSQELSIEFQQTPRAHLVHMTGRVNSPQSGPRPQHRIAVRGERTVELEDRNFA
jgi:DUF971 family protein